jgi:hypothetical protein
MAISRALAPYETINDRIKSWGCMSKTYRHEQSKHHILFGAVIAMTQFEILSTGYFPFEAETSYDHKDIIF